MNKKEWTKIDYLKILLNNEWEHLNYYNNQVKQVENEIAKLKTNITKLEIEVGKND